MGTTTMSGADDNSPLMNNLVRMIVPPPPNPRPLQHQCPAAKPSTKPIMRARMLKKYTDGLR